MLDRFQHTTGVSEPFTVGLDSVRMVRVPFGGYGYRITEFDGAADSVYIQTSPNRDDPGRAEVGLYAGEVYATPQSFWIDVITAQSGKSLVIRVATRPGAALTPAQSADEPTATSAKQDDMIDALANAAAVSTGQKTVATGTATAIASTTTPADGKAVVILADDGNAVDVFLGGSGVTGVDGFALAPGASIALQVTDVATVFAIAANADQKLYWIVETAS